MATLLVEMRKPLKEIIYVPPKVTSVYSLVQHVWAGDSEDERRQAKKEGRLRLETLQEFYLEPVRNYLNRFLEMVATGEGQGFWLQAEFGVGKSHMLAVEAILALGGSEVWSLVRAKEDETPEVGPGRRLDNLWADKISRKRIFPVIFSLEGIGGTENAKLEDFILKEAQDVHQLRTHRPLPVTPDDYLADWYLNEGHEDYEKSLRTFLADRRLMERLPNVATYDTFTNYLNSPDDRRDAATVLRAFLRHRKVTINLPMERGERLQTAFDTILKSGYDGILIVIDEMSEYFNRTKFPSDDEDCLLTLSNTLAKAQGKPIWTVVAAQTRYTNPEKIIGPDRMREELLEHKSERFRDIVVRRTRSYQVNDGLSGEVETTAYHQTYQTLIPWVKATTLDDFRAAFPFSPETIDVIRIISRELTGTRSTIGFLHAALKKAVEENIDELVALWRIFVELMSHEETPSRSSSGVISLKSKFGSKVDALEAAQNILDKVDEGLLGKKAHKRRAIRILNTLFLYHLAHYEGLKPEQVLDAVCDLKSGDETVELQVEYYTTLLEEMRLKLRQCIRARDGRYEFVPRESGEFDELITAATDTLHKDTTAFWGLFGELVAYNQPDLASPVANYSGSGLIKQTITWHGQERSGRVGMRDITSSARAETPDTYYQEDDFVVILSRRPAGDQEVERFLQTEEGHPDPRVIAWTMDVPTADEERNLVGVIACLKVAREHKGSRYEKEALEVFRQQAPRAFDLIKTLFGRGKARTCRKTISIDLVGGLEATIERMVGEALDECYLSASIDTGKRKFGTQETVKLINGLVKRGQAVPANDQLYSAVENFAEKLQLTKPVDPDVLNPSDSEFYIKIREFVEQKGSASLSVETIYRHFTGWNRTTPDGKSYGLTRRMVDIYLLCLVQQGHIRIQQKKGPWIDRTSIGVIDFKPDILKGMERVALPKPLPDWKYLYAYLEVMLDQQPGILGSNYELVKANQALRAVREVWKPSEKVAGLEKRVKRLFAFLGQPAPYDDLLLHWLEFFNDPLPEPDEEDEVVSSFIFQRILADAGTENGEAIPSQHLGEFRARWKQLNELLENFDDHETTIRAAGDYARIEVPEGAEFNTLRTAISKLPQWLANVDQLVVDRDMVKGQLEPALEGVQEIYCPLYLRKLTRIQEASRKLFSEAQAVRGSQEAIVLRELAANVTEADNLYKELLAQLEAAEKAGLRREYPEDVIKKNLTLATTVENDNNLPITLREMKSWLENIETTTANIKSLSESYLARLAAFINSSGVKSKLAKYAHIPAIALLDEKPGDEHIITCLYSFDERILRELGQHLKAALSKAAGKSVKLSKFKPSREYIWTDDDIEAVVQEFKEYLRASKPDDGVLRLQG
jgi:hypothetical protein